MISADRIASYAGQEGLPSDLRYAAKIMNQVNEYFASAAKDGSSCADKFMYFTFLNGRLTEAELETISKACRILEHGDNPGGGFEQEAKHLLGKLADLSLQAKKADQS